MSLPAFFIHHGERTSSSGTERHRNKMHIPLTYQMTEYDCGPTTLVNAIQFLFNREELSPDLLQAIYRYCLDGFNGNGEPGKTGTSHFCMDFMANWFLQYAKQRKFPLKTSFRYQDEVTMDEESEIRACLRRGGCVLIRCWLSVGHYILLTGMDEEKGVFYVFDPYYLEKPLRRKDITFVTDQPKKYNRIISIARIAAEGRDYYNIGEAEKREALLFERTDGRKR